VTAVALAGPAARTAPAPVVFEDPADDTGGRVAARDAVGRLDRTPAVRVRRVR